PTDHLLLLFCCRCPPCPPPFPYTTLFRSLDRGPRTRDDDLRPRPLYELSVFHTGGAGGLAGAAVEALGDVILEAGRVRTEPVLPDRKSTRLNSSHEWISYAVFCLKKKKKA